MNNTSFFKRILIFILILVILPYFTINFFNFNTDIKIREKYIYKKEIIDNDWIMYSNVIIINGKPNKLIKIKITCGEDNNTVHNEIFLFLKKHNVPVEHAYIKYSEEITKLDEYGNKEIPVFFIVKNTENINNNSIHVKVEYYNSLWR